MRYLLIILALTCTAYHAPSQAENRWARIRIPELNCHGCTSQIRNALLAVPGVNQVQVNRNKQEVKIIYDDEQAEILDLEAAIAAAGFVGITTSQSR